MEKLTDLKPQQKNANKHTQRGLGRLEESIRQDGWIGAITIAADGETFDGSARIEVGVQSGFEEAIVVESDGSRPVVVKRTDIPSADDPRAQRLGIAANRVAQIDLEWDPEILKELAQEVDLSSVFFENELAMLTGEVQLPEDPRALWQDRVDMGTEAVAHRQLMLYFKTAEDLEAFCARLEISLADNQKSLWYLPKSE